MLAQSVFLLVLIWNASASSNPQACTETKWLKSQINEITRRIAYSQSSPELMLEMQKMLKVSRKFDQAKVLCDADLRSTKL